MPKNDPIFMELLKFQHDLHDLKVEKMINLSWKLDLTSTSMPKNHTHDPILTEFLIFQHEGHDLKVDIRII